MKYVIVTVLKWVFLFLAAVLVQASIAPKIAIFGISPDFVMLLLFIFAIEYGKTSGILVGFIVGLFVDVYSAGILGVNALAKTTIGGAVGFFNRKNFMVGLVFQLILLTTAIIIHDIIIYIVNMVKTDENIVEIYKYIFSSSLPRAIYTTFVAALFFVLSDLFFPTKWRY